MHWLELKIPPPVVGVLIGVAMWFAPGALHESPIEASLRMVVAAVLAGLGLALMLAGSYAFHQAKTTVNPLKPESASALVVRGVYRLSRNPMYAGFAALLLAWAVYLAAPAAFAGPVLFVAYMTRFQIVPEERALAQKFGSEFGAYQQKVRRWL
jgi:protein-S-isoprenylcysteine O-methyltransferase Ste14